MSYKIPSFLYLSRVVLLLSTLLSLLFLEPATTAVIYLVVLAISFCEYYIQNKYFAGRLDLAIILYLV